MTQMREAIEASVRAHEEWVPKRRAHAEAAREALLASITKELQRSLSWMLPEFFKEKFAVTNRLGERLKQLKAEIAALIESIPDKVPEWFGAATLWPHREGAAEHCPWEKVAPNGPGSQTVKHVLDATIGTQLSKILAQYGYGSFAIRMEQRAIAEAVNTYIEAVNAYAGQRRAQAATLEQLAQQDAADLWRNA